MLSVNATVPVPAFSAVPPEAARMNFASLDGFHDFICQARPSMDWQGNQLSREPVNGSIFSCKGSKMQMTGVQTRGSFEMEGAISRSNLVIAIAVNCNLPGLFWRSVIDTGSVAIIQAGEPIYALNHNGLSYMTVDIPHDVLAAELERQGLAFTNADIEATGVLDAVIPRGQMDEIRRCVAAQHLGAAHGLPPGHGMEQLLLDSFIGVLTAGRAISRDPTTRSYGRIVARVREYIDAHLSRPISLDELCSVGCASKRTLHRAFLEVMGDTPQQFILKLRLNRIRRDLATDDEAERTVTVVSMRWGITELGRLAHRYREQFGELPSETLRRRRGGSEAFGAPESRGVAGSLHVPAHVRPVALLADPLAGPQLRHDLHCRQA